MKMLYLSNKLKEMKSYQEWISNFTSILNSHNIPHSFLDGTKDIWCRDYMPVCFSKEQIIRFRFDPDYLTKLEKYKTNQNEIKHPFETELKDSQLIMDGGNAIFNKTHLLVTNRVLKDNPNWSKTEITQLLKEASGRSEVTILPQVPYELTGHIDGMMQFLSEDHIMISDFSNQSKSYQDKLARSIKALPYQVSTLPYFESTIKNKYGDYTADGCYINFVQIGDQILFPQFNHPKDQEALKVISTLLPDKEIIPINITPISKFGGGLHCICWEEY